MKNALTKLLKVKSIVTIALTAGMVLLLTGVVNPAAEVLALYSASYGAVITYFFTKKDEKEGE